MNQFIRTKNYILEYIKIELKTLKEYKTNMFMGFVTSISYFFSQIVVLLIIYNSFNDLVNWSFYEYFSFFLFSNAFGSLAGIFYYKRALKGDLLTGIFNNHLIRPIHVFVMYKMSSSIFFILFEFLIEFISLIIFLIYYSNLINVLNLLLLIPFILLGVLLEIMSGSILDSLAFFIKSNNFAIDLHSNIKQVYYRYPSIMFKGLVYKFSFFIAVTYVAVFSTLFLFNRISYLLFFKIILLLILLNIIFAFILYLLWFFGLKKYEAYG